MSRQPLAERVTERLRALEGQLGNATIGGFWIRPDPYLDRDEAVVLVLDVLDDEGVAGPAPSTRAAVTRTLDIGRLVADALDGIITTSCRFGSSAALAELGPPLDPDTYHPVHAPNAA